MFLPLAVIVLASLHVGTAHINLIAANQEYLREEFNTALEKTIANVTGTCNHEDELYKIREQVAKVAQAVNTVNTTVQNTVDAAVQAAVETAVNTAVENATRPIESLLLTLLNEAAILKSLQLGPILASSCAEVLGAFPASLSGYYWVRASNGSVIRVYCDMTRTCGGITGGWMQVANIDMTNTDHTCPQGLDTITTASKRLCSRAVQRGCSSATFEVNGMQYTHVCGKIIGYQDSVPQAFYAYYDNQTLTIDDAYVDGVVLTHGANPRSHIWTFAAALDAYSQEHYPQQCPCINTGNSQTIRIPPWVGSDYFCDTAAEGRYQRIFYPNDPLWDGEGCASNSTCCSFNNPPWFSKQLPSPTTNDIEMRLCGQGSHRHSPVEKILLFVQ